MQTAFHLLQHYGLIVVFLTILLDQGGLPIPSFPVLLVAGALTLAGGPPLPAVLVAALAGSLAADTAWHVIGRRTGRRVLSLLCKVSLSPDTCVRQTETVFARVGPWALLFAKFVPGLGTISVAMSGISRLSVPLFILLDGVGATLYFGLPIVLGRFFHNAIAAVLTTLTQLGEYGVAIVVGALVLYLAVRWIERQLFIRRLRMDRISVDELAAMMASGNSPVILDVRSSETRLRDGIIPGAVGAHKDDIERLAAVLSRHAEVVVYCACPNEASAATAALHLRRAGFRKIRPLRGGIEAWAQAGHPIALVAEQAAA